MNLRHGFCVPASPDEVARFVVYVSSTEGDLTNAREVDVGKPQGTVSVDSTTRYSAVIDASATEFVAVTAIGSDGRTSPPSSWSALPPSPPGQPLLVP